MRAKITFREHEQIPPVEVDLPENWLPPSTWPYHFVYLCPRTGQAWAWIEWQDAGHIDWFSRYVSEFGQVPRGREEVPGSLLPGDVFEVPDTFPAALLEREFEAHADYFKKGYNK